MKLHLLAWILTEKDQLKRRIIIQSDKCVDPAVVKNLKHLTEPVSMNLSKKPSFQNKIN